MIYRPAADVPLRGTAAIKAASTELGMLTVYPESVLHEKLSLALLGMTALHRDGGITPGWKKTVHGSMAR